METQAQAKQLWFHYTDENGERTSPDILKDISLSIDKGDFVALGITALASQHLQNT